MQSVIGRLDDSVMRMIEDSVDESSKSRLHNDAEGSVGSSGCSDDKCHKAATERQVSENRKR